MLFAVAMNEKMQQCVLTKENQHSNMTRQNEIKQNITKAILEPTCIAHVWDYIRNAM